LNTSYTRNWKLHNWITLLHQVRSTSTKKHMIQHCVFAIAKPPQTSLSYTKYLLQAPKNTWFNIVSLRHQNLLKLLWVTPSTFYKHQKRMIQHCVFATPKSPWTSLSYTKYLLQGPKTRDSTLCLCNTKTSLNFFELHNKMNFGARESDQSPTIMSFFN
jgi:hypothetical protein